MLDSGHTHISQLALSSDLEELLGIGSSNSFWFPLSWSGGNNNTKWTSGTRWQNVDATDVNMMLQLLLPTSKGSRKLYIKGYKWYLTDADNNNYIENMYIQGKKSDASNTNLDTNSTQYKTVGEKNYSFGSPIDCSDYIAINMRLDTLVTNANSLDIDIIVMECYYE